MKFLQEKHWAIEYGFAKRIEPLVMAGHLDMLKGFGSNKPNNAELQMAAAPGQRQSGWVYSEGAEFPITTIDGVMIYNIIGATTAHGEECTQGYEQIARALRYGFNTDNIKGIVLAMDTPGGSVNGLSDLAREMAKKNKPVITYVTGMCCSAGMYQAAGTDGIIVTDANATTLGSIGVLQVLVDQSEALERMGLKVIIQRSSLASNKSRLNGIEPITDEMLAEEQVVLDNIEADFKAVMIAGRPNISKQVWKDEAKTYTGAQAIKLGLADKVGSLEDAVKLVLKKSISYQNKSNKNMSNLKLTALATIVGAESIIATELNDDNAYQSVSEAHLEALEAGVIALNGVATQLSDEQSAHAATQTLLEAAEGRATNAEATVTANADKVTKLEARNKQLEAHFAALKNGATGAGATGGDLGTGGDDKPNLSTAEKFPSLSKELGLK
jgi:ClpP class serine protease